MELAEEDLQSWIDAAGLGNKETLIGALLFSIDEILVNLFY